ncbi:MAG TPA: aspartate--tRNA ligase [bacterium]|nr:aspartate--tRNA ligase [bacterium]
MIDERAGGDDAAGRPAADGNRTPPAGSSELGDWRRTHTNGSLGAGDIGRDVTLMGWVQSRRDLGGLIFIDLRDRTGITQIVCNPQEAAEAAAVAGAVRSEYVLAVRGVVAARPAGTENPRVATGAVEVRAREVRVLNPADTPPFPIDADVGVDETVRLRYRYLDLRRSRMQANLELRHRLAKAVRDHLSGAGFLEIETPMLIKGTPEGARDFLVPSRVHPGKFYALPQSPQLFKQLLMVAGTERYFQIVRCFRDEDLRADRAPEFTQIDLEMSFVGADDVLSILEPMVAYTVREALGVEVRPPFPRVTYTDAMRRYGSDKPDLRFDLEIADCGDLFADSAFRVFSRAVASGGVVRVLCAPGAGGYSRRAVAELDEVAKAAGAAGLVPVHLDAAGPRGPLARHLSAETLAALRARCGAGNGDLLLLAAGPADTLAPAMGRVRLELGRRLNVIRDGFAFEWVVDFPLLERSAEGGLAAVHHPFTAPMDEDLPLIEREPLRVRAKAYDLVLNGVEMGSGSIRIHRQDLQQRMFALLGISPEAARERFGFLLDAFRYGAPPHGGFAFGFDRFVMVLAGEESIREVIAFPKTQSATDLMTGAPSEVDPRSLAEAHIEVRR